MLKEKLTKYFSRNLKVKQEFSLFQSEEELSSQSETNSKGQGAGNRNYSIVSEDISFKASTRSIRDFIIEEVGDLKLEKSYYNSNIEKKKKVLFALGDRINPKFIFDNSQFFDEICLDFLNKNSQFDFFYEFPKYTYDFMCMYSEFIRWDGYFGSAGRLRDTYYASKISQAFSANIPSFVLKKYAVPNWRTELALDGGNYKDSYSFTDWAYYSMNQNISKSQISEFKDYFIFPILSKNEDLPWDIDLFLITDAIDCPTYENPTWSYQDNHLRHWSIKGLLSNNVFIENVLNPIRKLGVLE